MIFSVLVLCTQVNMFVMLLTYLGADHSKSDGRVGKKIIKFEQGKQTKKNSGTRNV